MTTKSATLFFALAALVGATANAATVTWSSSAATVSGSFGINLNTGLFVTSGTEVLAENLGGAAVSFDGIDFAAGNTTFGGTGTSFHSVSSTALSRTGTFGTSGSDTINLSGLTSGNTYRVQVLVFDGLGPSSGRTVEFDGIDQGQYANGVRGVTWGDGLLVTGTFVADAATQDFTVEAFDGATSIGGQANALLLHNLEVDYTGWISGFDLDPADQVFTDDPDGDGLDNGLEGFFGTDPSAWNAGLAEVSSDGTTTTFTHPQAVPPLNDVTGSYEWSLDLGTWYAGDGVDGPGGGLTVSIPTVTPVGGTATVTATASAPVAKLFFRAVATN